MNIRTDMAVELQEMLGADEQKGIEVKKWKTSQAEVTQVRITDSDGEKKMGKPIGKYITVELPEFSHESELLDGRLETITELIKDLIPKGVKSFLVAGLGNEAITPDALGPLCSKKVFSTRHFENIAEKELGLPRLFPVSSISTGVLGQTGIETSEYICGVVNTVKPDLVIIIDALASRNLSQLGRTVQLSNTGITPGSGVGNHRKSIDRKILGVPVISIGVPTVIDLSDEKSAIVTPKEIDTIIKRAAALLGMSINCALQPNVSPEMFLALS